MRKSIKQFVGIVAQTLPTFEPIYEFGSLQVEDQLGFADMRPFFRGKEYHGCDMREGPGVDCILDLHHIKQPDNSVGTVLVLDTIEHVEFCREAIREVHRILIQNGIIVMTSVMNFYIHDHPYDYWRFTPEAFKSLLKPFDFSFVDFAGDERFPHTVIGIGCKGSIPERSMNEFMEKFEHWKERWCAPPPPSTNTHWKELVRLFTPPILLDFYKKVR